MQLATCLLPIAAVRVENAVGEIIDFWCNQPELPLGSENFIWFNFVDNIGKFGVDWRDTKSPTKQESRYLVQLCQQYFQHLDPISSISFEQADHNLLSTLSHDLRSPLSPIVTATDLLKLNPDRSTNQKYINSITDNAHKALALADGLLQLLKANNLATSSFLPVELASTVNQAVSRLSSGIQRKSILVEFTHQKPIFVFGNENLLTQTFINVLDNAIKFSPDKSTITINLTTENAMAICQVEDHGCGIKNKALHYIFKPVRTDNNEPGIGLGLVIAKTVIEKHAGKISVNSKPGKGSKFVLSIPILNSSHE